MPISMAVPGETKKIVRVGGNERVKQHLAELGFTADTDVTVMNKVGDSVIVMVRDARIALDPSLANKIMV